MSEAYPPWPTDGQSEVAPVSRHQGSIIVVSIAGVDQGYDVVVAGDRSSLAEQLVALGVPTRG